MAEQKAETAVELHGLRLKANTGRTQPSTILRALGAPTVAQEANPSAAFEDMPGQVLRSRTVCTARWTSYVMSWVRSSPQGPQTGKTRRPRKVRIAS